MGIGMYRQLPAHRLWLLVKGQLQPPRPPPGGRRRCLRSTCRNRRTQVRAVPVTSLRPMDANANVTKSADCQRPSPPTSSCCRAGVAVGPARKLMRRSDPRSCEHLMAWKTAVMQAVQAAGLGGR